MANTLEYAKLYQEGLDLVLEQAPLNWMTLDNSRSEYNGGMNINSQITLGF